MVMAVGMSGNGENLRLVQPEHFSGIGVYRYLPFVCEKTAPFFITIAAGGKGAVRVSAHCAGMGAWFFPQAVFLKQAGDTAKADNCGTDFFQDYSLPVCNFASNFFSLLEFRAEYITGVTNRVIKKLTVRPPTKVCPMG